MGSRESTGRQGLLVPHRLEGAGRGLPRGRHVDVRCRSGPPGGTEHRRPRRAAQHAGPDARSVTAAREVPAVRLAAARHRGAGQPARRRQGSCRDDRLGRHARGRWGQGARRGAQGLSAALRDPGQAAGISPVPASAGRLLTPPSPARVRRLPAMDGRAGRGAGGRGTSTSLGTNSRRPATGRRARRFVVGRHCSQRLTRCPDRGGPDRHDGTEVEVQLSPTAALGPDGGSNLVADLQPARREIPVSCGWDFHT